MATGKKLSELVEPRLIWLDFRAKDKWEAIETILDFLIRHGTVSKESRGEYLTALTAREKLASTGTGHGVALPHAAVDGLGAPVVFIGLSTVGVPFGASDGQPAGIVVLLLIPRQTRQEHIQTLASIARVLNREETRKKLLGAADAKDVVNLIRAEEQGTEK